VGRLLDKEVVGINEDGSYYRNIDAELVWNALRFANTAILEGHNVKIFLLGAGVEIETITGGKFNVQEQLQKFNELSGTCLLAANASNHVRCNLLFFPSLQ
jgi:sulfur relay (sulfurtransferase) complex TusBCD TusD component (DsrE family)